MPFEETGVESEVGLCGGLPFQVAVTTAGGYNTRNDTVVRAIEVVGAVTQVVSVTGIVSVVVADGRVTILSPGCAEFQIVHILVLWPELLLTGTPGSGECGEDARVVVFVKTRSLVTAQRSTDQVTVGIVVVEFAEE